ncbi:MAG: 4-alpha-glucanotransferase [Flavobacteriales bacterium]|jgi:4-alpha-glucanotransferase
MPRTQVDSNNASFVGAPLTRTSGVLLHISSLPSAHGIGDMGIHARKFAQYLKSAKQRYWQILPLNPSNPSGGESPYFSSSAFAGNPLLIDLIDLQDRGLLTAQELASAPTNNATNNATKATGNDTSTNSDEVNFTAVRSFKTAALTIAATKYLATSDRVHYNSFCQQHAHWLDDFALFSVLGKALPEDSWQQWPTALRDREPDTLEKAKKRHAKEIECEKVIQFLFFEQWYALKSYCNDLGLIIFGDMPIYVNYESADVWAKSQFFKLNADKTPISVSGVPPDFFSATGQLWNNPVYNWNNIKADNYGWWKRRMTALFDLYDIVRIDHFRGLIQYWEVPAGDETAINGSWEDAPAYELFDAFIEHFPQFPVVIEDLGLITEDVKALKTHYKLPGMLILQFAFDGDGETSPDLPQNHIQHSLAYIGSHDNTTCIDWYNKLNEPAKARVDQALNPYQGPLHERLVTLLMNSKSDLAVVCAQDLLALDEQARMNNPATNINNWKWKLRPDEFEKLIKIGNFLQILTEDTERAYQS